MICCVSLYLYYIAWFIFSRLGPAQSPGPQPGPPGGPGGPPGGPPGGAPPTGSPGAATNGPRPGYNSQNVQKMLDENSSLIKTIADYQGMGRHQESMNYQVNNNINIKK